MNKKQVKILRPLLNALREAADAIEANKSEIESIRNEEQEKFDNMPDGLKSSERGEAFDTIVQALSAIVDYDAQSLIDAIDDVEGAL